MTLLELPLPARVTCPACLGSRLGNQPECRVCGDAGTIVQFITREDQPCPQCGSHEAAIRQSGPGVSARCRTDGTFIYVVPKSELGLERRSVKSRKDLKDGQRERILAACNYQCFNCGRSPTVHGIILHVAHLWSWARNNAAPVADRLSDDAMNSDANLAACCEECNLAMGTAPIDPVIYARLCIAKMMRRKD